MVFFVEADPRHHVSKNFLKKALYILQHSLYPLLHLCTHLQLVTSKMSPTQCSSFHVVALGISFLVRVNPRESYNQKWKGDRAFYSFLSRQISNILHHDSLATPTPFFPLWVTFLFWEHPLQLSGEMALKNLLVPIVVKI